MSTAVFPLGMNSKPSSGYNHNGVYYNKQYISWKGTGINGNPVGSAAGHIRPLTNKDPGNVFPTGFGLARPMKHYRKGRVIQSAPITGGTNINEIALINYNMNRYVKSSKGTSLGGGFGGSGLLNEIQDKPGSYIVKQNIPTNEVDANTIDNSCKTCESVAIVSSYYPNNSYLTDNPNQTTTTSRKFCCNEEYKAKRRSMYASTNLKKNYYTTTKQYLQNRCKTYEQKSFNFVSPYQDTVNKPGGPETLTNTYLANCYPNTTDDKSINTKDDKLGYVNHTGCRLTVYKPNNYQFAKQGAVDCSTRNLKLNVTTISTNAASIKGNQNTGQQLVNANQLYAGDAVGISNLTKNKTPKCGAPFPLNFSQSGKFQNKKFCYYKQMPEYSL
ncbi:hypothetical protein N9K75_00345 [bacterium]|nr:hypothetical protein [bacterium]